MVLLNCRELHIRVWKYTDLGEGVFDIYMSRVLAKFSVPNMENSINLRLNITDPEPAEEETSYFGSIYLCSFFLRGW